MTLLATAHQIQDETGTHLSPVPFFAQEMEFAAYQLTSEKGADQNREGYELPAQAGQQAKSYHKRNRRMDWKKPTGRKLLLVCPPVPERKIKNKDKGCYGYNIHSCLLIHSLLDITTEGITLQEGKNKEGSSDFYCG